MSAAIERFANASSPILIPATNKQPHPRTHLFTVRLWVEPLGDEQGERMQVRHVLSGETRYFHT